MSKLKHILSFLLLISLLVSLCILPAQASPQSQGKGKVVLFIIDNINYDDIVRYGGENLHYLLEHGALGLMNTNSGGSYKDSHSYATLGSGSYAVCSDRGIYVEQQEDGSIVNRDLSSLVQANDQLDRHVKVGLIGSLLNDKGFKTAVIGTESIAPEAEVIEARSALITMNEQGVTDYGQVGSSLLKKDPEHPCGFSTDYDALFASYQQFNSKADFIVIQSGDTHRLNKCKNVPPKQLEKAKATIFNNIDLFMGRVLESLDQDSLLLVMVPFPAQEDIAAGKKLTPVMAYGSSIPRGILTSSTTKRDGIITNTDLATEVAFFFDLDLDSSMIGHQLVYKSQEEPLNFINNINKISAFNYRYRSKIISTFISFVVVVLLLYVVCINCCPYNLGYIKALLMSAMLLPTLFLLLPLFNPWNIRVFISLALLLTVIISLAIVFWSKDVISTVYISLLFSAALIVGDTVCGNPLMRVSMLGYDPIVGARFYGIGNEYMGFLLGSTIMGVAGLIEKHKHRSQLVKLVSIAAFTFVFFILAMPTLGTNVGGSIAAFFGFGTFVVLMFKGRITKKDLILLGLGLLVFLLILFIFDGMRSPEKQSHIGQFSSMVSQEGVWVLLQVFKRKLLMNYRLIKHSIWTRILIVMVVVFVAMIRWPVRIIEQILDRYLYLYYGFVAGIVGTVAALICNDSGVVAAATCILPVGISLLVTANSRF